MRLLICFIIIISFIGCSLQTVSIPGTVYKQDNVTPLAGVEVKSGGADPVFTDSAGKFFLSGKMATAGKITLYFSKQGYQNANLIVNVVADNNNVFAPDNTITVSMQSNS